MVRLLSYLDPVHLVERPPVLLVVLGVPEVPPEVVQDAEVVLGQAVRHEVVVQVAVPGDGEGHHAALDGHPAEVSPGQVDHVAQAEDLAALVHSAAVPLHEEAGSAVVGDLVISE